MNAVQAVPGGGSDAFVTKLSPDGRTIVYSTFLGGQFGDEARAIAVDRHGRVYVAGSTSSPDFPRVHALQPRCAGLGREDAFVARLNASGSALDYSTCLGGEGDTDQAFALAVDEAGNAYVAGMTGSKDFPTRNALQPVHGDTRIGVDAFVSVIRPDGSDFVYSTFLGGGSFDEAHGIAVDGRRNVYVTGRTGSADFPVFQAFQPQLRGATDAFVTKIDRRGSIAWSTYFGGAVGLSADGVAFSRGGDETGLAIGVDRRGSVYVSGRTNSTDLPVLNAAQPCLAGPQHPTRFTFTNDVFVASLDADGTPAFVTYAGGNGNDEPTALAVNDDDRGGVWITGKTESGDFPAVRPRQAVFRSTDGGVTWTRRVGPGPFTTVVIDPVNPSNVYAAEAARGFGAVVRSTDGGVTWAARSGGPFGGKIHHLAIDASNPLTIYAATDSGLFKTVDGAESWAASGPGVTTRTVNAVAIDPVRPNLLHIGTHGTSDAFVLGFRRDGSIRASSYLGGNLEETGGGIAAGRDGRIYVSGATSSPDFPTAGAIQSATAGSTDAFVTILSRNRHRRHHRH